MNLIDDINIFNEIIGSSTKFHTLYLKTDNPLESIKGLKKPNYFSFYNVNSQENNFIADPFLFKKDDRVYLFAETNTHGRGSLVYTDITEGFSGFTAILERPWHLSYPFVFEAEGEVYMLPEQGTNNKPLTLYKAENFPNDWIEYIDLLPDPCIDSNIIYLDAYYLFTYNITLGKYCLYYSDSLKGEWTLHKDTPNKGLEYGGHGNGRGAGSIFKVGKNLYRPIQLNETKYGEGLQMQKITKLTKDKLEEKTVFKLDQTNIHHVSVCDNLIAFDYNLYLTNPLFPAETIEILHFWNQHYDRHKQREIYKEIGQTTGKVLDIGCEFYNKYNKRLFNNEKIDYYVMDVREIEGLSCDTFLLGSFLEIEYNNYFDVLISFGVLGFCDFTTEEIIKYINNAFKVLKPDGMFYLKTDNHPTEIKESYFNEFTLISKEVLGIYDFYKFQKC